MSHEAQMALGVLALSIFAVALSGLCWLLAKLWRKLSDWVTTRNRRLSAELTAKAKQAGQT